MYFFTIPVFFYNCIHLTKLRPDDRIRVINRKESFYEKAHISENGPKPDYYQYSSYNPYYRCHYCDYLLFCIPVLSPQSGDSVCGIQYAGYFQQRFGRHGSHIFLCRLVQQQYRHQSFSAGLSESGKDAYYLLGRFFPPHHSLKYL